MSYGWHQWQLPQSQKRLLAHSLVVVLTSITAKGAGQSSGCALKNSCQLQREGSRYPQGRTKHQRQTPGLSQPPFGLDCTTQDFQMYISSMGEHFVNLGSLLLRLACRNPASSKTAFFPIKLESGWSWKREDRRTEYKEFPMTSLLRTRSYLYPSIKSSTAKKVWEGQQTRGNDRSFLRMQPMCL